MIVGHEPKLVGRAAHHREPANTVCSDFQSDNGVEVTGNVPLARGDYCTVSVGRVGAVLSLCGYNLEDVPCM